MKTVRTPSSGKRIPRLILLAWVVLLAGAIAWQIRPEPAKPPPPGWRTWKGIGSILGMTITGKGVFAGGSKGLFLIEPEGTVKEVVIPGMNGQVMVYSLVSAPDGAIWVGHEKGLSRLHGSRWTMLTGNDGLPAGAVKALAVTRDEHVWLGTDNGAARLPAAGPWDRTSIVVVTARGGLLNNIVSALLEDGEGGMWFGNYASFEGGLSRLREKQSWLWTMKEGLPHPNITSLLLDRDGRVWAGCGFLDRGGAVVFGRSSGNWRLEQTIPAAELAGAKVRSLFQDSRGRVWLGSEQDGIAVRLGNRTVRVLTTADGLASQEVLVIAEARDRSIWLGTSDGVTRIGPDGLSALFPR
jgi:ligand-binding sensor domain-containing protein